MAYTYTINQDSAVDGMCSGASSNGDLNLREEYFIVVLLSLEWLVFVGFLGFPTCQLVLQNIWKKEEGKEVDDLAVLQKPPPINENLQQEDEGNELHDYAEDVGSEFNFDEDFHKKFDSMQYLTEEDSKEEEKKEEEDEDHNDKEDDDYDDDDDKSASVCFAVNRFLNEEVKYKLSYFFRGLDVLDSHLLVTDEPTAYETSDEAFEGIAYEELWGRNNDWDYEDEDGTAECYFSEECRSWF